MSKEISVWEKRNTLPRFEPLEGDKSVDVLVVGGGLAGLLCGYMLRREGVQVLIAEAQRICGGVTANTTAKITSQHGLFYSKLLKTGGEQVAAGYLQANEAAIKRYRELCADIGCSFEERPSFIYSRADRRCIEEELNALRRLGYPALFRESLTLPFRIAGAVGFARQAQFDPLAFAAAIADSLPIVENTRVLEIRGDKAICTGGTVTAKAFIIATHFPFINKYGGYFAKLYQQRSYVCALKGGPGIDGMYLDASPEGMSLRQAGDLLLLGGGGHRTGTQGGGWRQLRAMAARYYPHMPEALHWATQDCMSLDGVPYIGRYSRRLPNCFVATGFNKWGMSSSMVAATLLSDMVQGRKNEFEEIFAPSRSMLTQQLGVNLMESAKGLLTPLPKRCPHMGCALHWNAQEHSWDCACHGSRFGEDGRLLDNPATGGLGRRKRT